MHQNYWPVGCCAAVEDRLSRRRPRHRRRPCPHDQCCHLHHTTTQIYRPAERLSGSNHAVIIVQDRIPPPQPSVVLRGLLVLNKAWNGSAKGKKWGGWFVTWPPMYSRMMTISSSWFTGLEWQKETQTLGRLPIATNSVLLEAEEACPFVLVVTSLPLDDDVTLPPEAAGAPSAVARLISFWLFTKFRNTW